MRQKGQNMMRTTVTTYIEERNSTYNYLVSVNETGELKVYRENLNLLKGNYALRDIVKRAKVLQKLYSSTNVEIESFCKKFSQYTWEYKFNEHLNESVYHKVCMEYPATLEKLHEMVCKYANIRQGEISVGDFDEYEKSLTEKNKREKLREAGIKLGENAILLDNNKYLVNDYGKYCSGITFIIAPSEILNYEYSTDWRLEEKLNTFWDGSPSFMYGNYWKSKKGSNCFAPCDKKDAKHILIALKWGGCGSSTSGSSKMQNALYYRKASSNGGGSGYTYYVIQKGSRNSYSEEDI